MTGQLLKSLMKIHVAQLSFLPSPQPRADVQGTILARREINSKLFKSPQQ
jgi:hypothetical protein